MALRVESKSFTTKHALRHPDAMPTHMKIVPPVFPEWGSRQIPLERHDYSIVNAKPHSGREAQTVSRFDLVPRITLTDWAKEHARGGMRMVINVIDVSGEYWDYSCFAVALEFDDD